MVDQRLAELVEQAFAHGLVHTYQRAALSGLHALLRQAWQRLKQPLQVAVVGRTQSGKSTLVQALGMRTALSHAADFPQDDDFVQLFALIDAPDQDTFYEYNTGCCARKSPSAMYPAGVGADVILYLCNSQVETAERIVVEFAQQGQSRHATPLNALGILAKVDALWPAHPSALRAGRRFSQALRERCPALRSMFSALAPVCGSLAWGAQTMTAEEFATLQQICALSVVHLQTLLRSGEGFIVSQHQNLPATSIRREALLGRLGTYGIWRAYHLLQARQRSRESLVLALLQDSGLPALKHLLLAHFGKRASLVKMSNALQHIALACAWTQQSDQLLPADRDIVRQIEYQFKQLGNQGRGVREWSVLRDYYLGRVAFTEEEATQLLRVTGRYGSSFLRQPGLSEKKHRSDHLAWQEILETANAYRNYWCRRVIDPQADCALVHAAAVLITTYDEMRRQTQEQLQGSLGESRTASSKQLFRSCQRRVSMLEEIILIPKSALHLKRRTAAANAVIEKYARHHRFLDISSRVAETSHTHSDIVSILAPVAARAPALCQALVRELVYIYSAPPQTIAYGAVSETIASLPGDTLYEGKHDLIRVFGPELLLDLLYEIWLEVGVSALPDLIPLIKKIGADTVDATFEATLVWHIGTMTALYFLYGEEWVISEQETRQRARKQTGLPSPNATRPRVLQEIPQKTPEIEEKIVRGIQRTVQLVQERNPMMTHEQLLLMLRESGISDEFITAGLQSGKRP